MTGRAKRIYFLLKNKSKENETERAMILKTAEEILTLKQWLVFRMKINEIRRSQRNAASVKRQFQSIG